MATLLELREKNPGLTIHLVSDEAFKPFGRVISYNADSLIALTREKMVMPSDHVEYRMACPELEAHPAFLVIQNVWMGEKETQLGICMGKNNRLNALEYHRASEFNVAVTDMVLLLAGREKMEGNTLSVSHVKAFFVPCGACIEVYATAMHYCPIQTGEEGFMSLVILPKGTNGGMAGKAQVEGEGRLLFAKDKWLVCHPDCGELTMQGAFAGIKGENIAVLS